MGSVECVVIIQHMKTIVAAVQTVIAIVSSVGIVEYTLGD